MRIYEIENQAWRGARSWCDRRSMTETCRIRDQVCAYFELAPIEIRPGHRGQAAHYFPVQEGLTEPHITIGKHAERWVVLHELAHYLAHMRMVETRTNNYKYGSGHDRRFVAAYCDIIRLVLGPQSRVARGIESRWRKAEKRTARLRSAARRTPRKSL